MLSNFTHTNTGAYLQEEKESIFTSVVDTQNVPSLLLSDGALTAPVSLAHFLEDVPMYALYDDIPCERPIELEEKEMCERTPVEEAPSLTQSLWNSMF